MTIKKDRYDDPVPRRLGEALDLLAKLVAELVVDLRKTTDKLDRLADLVVELAEAQR